MILNLKVFQIEVSYTDEFWACYYFCLCLEYFFYNRTLYCLLYADDTLVYTWYALFQNEILVYAF